jgi:Zn-dependent alcohol dehydrogenase
MRLPAVVLDRPGVPPTLREVTIDPPGPGEVAVSIQATGVCHTDLAAVRDARAWPLVLGHEGAGTVDEVGPDVTTPAVGDHVVVCWQAKCGSCRNCLAGRRELCERILGTAAPRVWLGEQPLSLLLNAGTFCPRAIVPAGGAVPIRKDIALTTAALLGCAVATGLGAAINRPEPRLGDDVVVIGAGGVGLNIVQGARLSGAATIIAIDRDVARLALAETFGATACLLASADPVRDVLDRTRGRGVDHVFEVTGQPGLIAAGIEMLARGGTLTLVGASARSDTVVFPPRAFLSRQQRIRGCIYGDIVPERDLPLFADWYMDGRLRLDELGGEIIELTDVPALFLRSSPGPAVRTIVAMAG